MKNLVIRMVATLVSVSLAAPLFVSLPALADSIEHTSSSSSSSETIDIKKGVKLKFRQRLNDLHSQIDTAVAKGWISGSQASGFRTEADALLRETATAEAADWPESQVDHLEKAVTKLNASLSSASTSSGSKASVTAAPAVAPKAASAPAAKVSSKASTKKSTVKVKKTTSPK